jgi:hypothetical protein
MIATEAILVIAFCLAVVAVIGIRIALSLADIEKSLDRVATALEGRAADHAPLGSAGGPGLAGAAAMSTSPNDSELAAAIAAAARYRKAPPAAAPANNGPVRASTTAVDDGNGIVDAAAERT